MNNGFILTARFYQVLVAWRHSFFHFTIICFRKQRYVLDLPATEMNTHHKAAAGKQHHEGECYR